MDNMFSSKRKNEIVDRMEQWCSESKISNFTLGHAIRSYHVSLPLILLILTYYAPKCVVQFIILNLIIASVFFNKFNGCILTKLETRLCGAEFTLADLFVEMFNLELNNRNRMIVSYFIASGFWSAIILIYFFRFI